MCSVANSQQHCTKKGKGLKAIHKKTVDECTLRMVFLSYTCLFCCLSMLLNSTFSCPHIPAWSTRLGYLVLLVLLTLMSVSGCSVMQPNANLVKASNVQALSHWQINGKIAFITPTNKQSLNVIWLQDDQNYKVTFNTFLGINVLTIIRNQQGIVIEIDDQIHQSDDPQQLIFELTGWWLPIDQLSRWLKADIQAAEGRLVLDKNKQIREFTPICNASTCQSDYTITYNQYRNVQRLTLPHQITIRTSGMMTQTLKLKIQQWR